ncbi:MAG TPA: hypothetical protein VI757_03875 [Bacteroidia bacterium]|nr:hypothetical protein [Bacteroidia bacterium]
MNTKVIIGGIILVAVVGGFCYCIYKIDKIETRQEILFSMISDSSTTTVPTQAPRFIAQRPIGYKPEWSL